MSLKYKNEDGKIYELESGTPSRVFDPESEEAMSGIAIAQQLPFRLGVDEEGNYGYYKDGADTVTPFKQKEKEPVWTRPAEWPDLDTLPAEGQIIYITLDNTDRKALFAIGFNIKNYKVEIGNIIDGEFQAVKTQNVVNNVNWVPDFGYFADVDIDYPIVKVTSTENIGQVKYQNPKDIVTNTTLPTRMYNSIVEAYYSLPYATAISYYGSYHTQHVKLMNLTTKVTTFSQAFQDSRKLKLIELENCDTSKVTTFAQMVFGAHNLIDTSFMKDLDCSSCTTLASMFYGSQVYSIDFNELKNTDKVTDLNKVCSYCPSLAEVKIDGNKFPSLTNFTQGFGSIGSYITLDLSSFDVTNVTHTNLLSGIKSYNLKLPSGYTQSLNMSSYLNSRAEILDMFDQLGTVPSGSTATFTLGTNNLKTLADADKAIAIEKGWTLA